MYKYKHIHTYMYLYLYVGKIIQFLQNGQCDGKKERKKEQNRKKTSEVAFSIKETIARVFYWESGRTKSPLPEIHYAFLEIIRA